MLNTISINLKTDIKTDRPTSLPITLMSQDKNNNQFILRFTNGGEPVTLDDTYTVEVLTKFSKSRTSRLTSAIVRQDYATWEFDTAYITQDEMVYNYVYVRKSGSLIVSADANCFVFSVDLSEIDKGAGKVAETYDENYQKYLDEFKDNVDFEEIAQAEQARKEAELLRQESYDAKVDTAIVEADVVSKVDSKVTELTPQINNLTAQLAQTDEQVIKQAKRDVNLNTIKRNIPLVSFVDDDGNPAILTKLKPLSQTYGVPFTVCAPSDFIKGGQSLSAEQLKDLQDNHGFEIASHGKTHTAINSSMSEEQQFTEVYESWRQMREWGLNVETMVYPYGQSTPYVKEIVSRYYKAGVSTNTHINNTPLVTYNLGRYSFPTTGWTLDDYKAKVDEAVANKSWLIFMLHCGQAVHDGAQQQILEQLIQYIQSINVDIVNVTDGIDISGNIIDINQQEIFWAKNGENNIRDAVYHKSNPQTDNEIHNGLSKLSDFPEFKMSIDPVVGPPSQQSFPTLTSRGTLLTINNRNNLQGTQLFVGRRKMFARSTGGAGGEWDDWRTVLLGIEKQVSADFGTLEPGERKQVAIGVPGMVAGHYVMLTPTTNILSNIDFSYQNSGAGILRATLINHGPSARTIGVLNFNLFVTSN